MLQAATNLDTMKDLLEARRVLSFEAKALEQLAHSLNEDFSAAVKTIRQIRGRCILVGIGKSGHVARKIAATLASTGTPAFFVHPAEASHGDLGMIHREDAVIALSNSGETVELLHIIAYCKRHQIPLVSITSGPDSVLATAATHTLLIPQLREACPLGLAPMTSTTMMIGLGDALAAALLQYSQFSPEDFSVFHPGGALGKKLKITGEIMHTGCEMPLARPETPMQEVLIEMTSKRFGCVGILDGEQHLIGVITDGDLRRHMNSDLLLKNAKDLMTKTPQTLHNHALLEEAVATMNEKKITSLFITEKGCDVPVGIINIHDCLKAN